MLKEAAAARRGLKTVRMESDLAVVGGGLAGVCCAVTAARAGIRVMLIQDRPVLGGNASSEVRLWMLGATSHLGNNNRWSREGGLVDEILVENVYRNPEGNPYVLDSILLEKVVSEPNITLLLNTAVHDLDKRDPDTIAAVRAYCSQNETIYEVSAPLFCDASGDGVVGFLAGAAFRMGAESREEFGEKFAPSGEYGELLGHSIYFYSKDAGRPVRFIPPAYALKDITQIPRYRSFNTSNFGCRLWWIEYGGRLDTVHETERIKWELWKVVYGVWNHIKNSGQFPEAETLTLEWVGTIPGKRESRRFEGDCMLIQQDIVEQRSHPDAVSYGGWSIDLHPADGVFSERPGCNQWHSKGIYQIPYRCLYSRNIRNLFLAGRIISASHVAFGSSRVMATCGHSAQAVGLAAAICRQRNLQPRDLVAEPAIHELQRKLVRSGQYIPGTIIHDPEDLAQTARLSATSELRLAELPSDGALLKLEQPWAQLLPVSAGQRVPAVTLTVDAAEATSLEVEWRLSRRCGNYTPDVVAASKLIRLREGKGQTVRLAADLVIELPQYIFICLSANKAVSVHTSPRRITGIVSAANRYNPAVASGHRQNPPPDIGVEAFEFWCPQRRPGGHNLAMTIEPAIALFAPANVLNGVARPTNRPNAWVADPADPHPRIILSWERPQAIKRIELSFDTDFDHPMESVLMGHPENVMPFVIRKYRILDGGGRLLHECPENHQTRSVIVLEQAVRTRELVVEVEHPGEHVPAALLEVRCYKE